MPQHDSGPEASTPHENEHDADSAPAFAAFAKSVPMPSWSDDDPGDGSDSQDPGGPGSTAGQTRLLRLRASTRTAPSAEPEAGGDGDDEVPVEVDLRGGSGKPAFVLHNRAAYGVGIAVLAGLAATWLAITPSPGHPSAALGATPQSAGSAGSAGEAAASATGTPPWTFSFTPTPSTSGGTPAKPAGQASLGGPSPASGAPKAAGVGGGGASGGTRTAGDPGSAGSSGGGSKTQGGGSGNSSSTSPPAPQIQLYAGPGCSTDSGATAFVDYSWYSGTNSNGTTGWTSQSSGGYSGCSGHFQSMPMSGNGSVTEHASWYFHFSTSISRCQLAVYIPTGSLAQVGGDPADYGYYIGGSESAAGTFSVAQLSHEGSWVIVNTFGVHGGEFEIQEYNAGVDYDSSNWNAHDAAAQMAVSCD